MCDIQPVTMVSSASSRERSGWGLSVGAVSFFIVLLLVGQRFPKFAMRVLPPWAFGLLLLITIMNHLVFSEALYLRAHKKEPFLEQTVIAAILLSFSTFFLGKYVGANAVTIGYFAVCAVFGLPSATYIFITKRREWHGKSIGANGLYPKRHEANG